MLKLGPKDNYIASINHQLFCKHQKPNHQLLWKQMILFCTAFFKIAHAKQTLRGSGQRTKDLQFQSQAGTMWDMKARVCIIHIL